MLKNKTRPISFQLFFWMSNFFGRPTNLFGCPFFKKVFGCPKKELDVQTCFGCPLKIWPFLFCIRIENFEGACTGQTFSKFKTVEKR